MSIVKRVRFSNSLRNAALTLAACAVAGLTLVGCQRAESPSMVSKDVATAEQREASHAEKARQDAAQDVANAQSKVDQKLVDRDNVAAKDAYKVAIAKADGNHDVALQECKALSGDAQSRCKQRADADYDAAKANAKDLEVSRTR